MEPQLPYSRVNALIAALKALTAPTQVKEDEMLRTLQSNLGTLWCKLAHESLMWPVHGKYECAECGRRYPAFANTAGGVRPAPIVLRSRVSSHPTASFGRV